MSAAKAGTTRWIALLRGVSPTNASMPKLKVAFEAAGFVNVKTVLASGNVAFDARAASEAALERAVEAAIAKSLGRTFSTRVRSQAALQALLDADPFAAYRVPANAKRVVSFLRAKRKPLVALPHGRDGATIHGLAGREAFTSYLPSPKGPVFMKLIEEAFGDEVTTRTLDTVAKLARA